MGVKANALRDMDTHNLADSKPAQNSIKLPSIAAASQTAAAAANEGNIYYDLTGNTVKISDGSSWTDLSTTAGVGTLEQVTTAGASSDVTSVTFTGSAASATAFRVGGAAANNKIVIYHDATDGHINTLAGDLHLEPAGADVYVTGDVYISADAQVTGAVNGATGTIGSTVIAATTLSCVGPAAHATNTLQYSPVIIRKAISHGDEDGNFDIIIFNANAPKMEILDMWLDVNTTDGAATTGALRDAAASAGNAITSEISQNSAVIGRTTSVANASLAANASLFYNSTAALTNLHATINILAILLA